MKSVFLLIVIITTLFCFEVNAQVNTDFNLEYDLFLGVYTKGKTQWVCGMIVESIDSTNRELKVRFDVVKDWVEQDSLECIVSLDTTQIYLQKFDDTEYQALKYTSQTSGVAVFIGIPDKYEYMLPNGMNGVSYNFRYANAILPGKWKKHQKRIKVYFEK